jgi:hypothetical protein
MGSIQLPFPSERPCKSNQTKIVRGCLLVILILSSRDTSLGQEKPEVQIGKQPVIKVQTTLVMVPAIVTDRSGSHIDDLKAEDFQVSRNGKTQKIAFFRHVLTKPELMRSAPAPSPDGFTNALESNNQRLTILQHVAVTKCGGGAEPLEYAGNRDKFSGYGHGRSRSRNAGSTA